MTMTIESLSNNATVVLSALIGSMEFTGGDHGFIDEAYEDHIDSERITKNMFAGLIGALDGFFDWKDDLKQDSASPCGSIQFALIDEVYAARDEIHAAAQAIVDMDAQLHEFSMANFPEYASNVAKLGRGRGYCG